MFVSFENKEDDNANGNGDHHRWYSYSYHDDANVRSERAREGTVLGAHMEEIGDGDGVGDTLILLSVLVSFRQRWKNEEGGTQSQKKMKKKSMEREKRQINFLIF